MPLITGLETATTFLRLKPSGKSNNLFTTCSKNILLSQDIVRLIMYTYVHIK